MSQVYTFLSALTPFAFLMISWVSDKCLLAEVIKRFFMIFCPCITYFTIWPTFLNMHQYQSYLLITSSFFHLTSDFKQPVLCHIYNHFLHGIIPCFRNSESPLSISSIEYWPPNILYTYSGVTHPKSMEHDLASFSSNSRNRSSIRLDPFIATLVA